MPTEIIDPISRYRGSWGSLARCRLRLVHRDAGDVVIASELPDNAGASITNMADTNLHSGIQDADQLDGASAPSLCVFALPSTARLLSVVEGQGWLCGS